MSKRYKYKKKNALAIPAPLQTIGLYLVAVLTFFLICLCNSSTIKSVGLIMIVAALLIGCIRFKTLRDQIRSPLIALALVVLFDLISSFYAVSGKFALYDFLPVIVGFSLVLIFLSAAPSEGITPGRRIATILARVTALIGLVSIDLISTRWISGLFLKIIRNFTTDFEGLTGVEAGVRMTSIFVNPNVFAGIVGIGVLLSLALVLSSENAKERANHTVVLFINALAFVLAFSMGATGVIAIAFLVYLILEQKGRRAALFVLMVETLVVAMIGVALVSMTSLDTWSGFQPVPLLCVIVGSAVLCLLNHYLGQPIAEKLSKHGKTLLIVVIALVVALVAVVLFACNTTTGATLTAGEGLRRSVYPDAGNYTISAETSGPVYVSIESQNLQEAMMHTSTILYKGNLADASFSVPEDSRVVYFNFSTKQDVHLDRVCLNGSGSEIEVPLSYTFLPSFIANRIQGLFANQNALQRFVFFEDALKLFQRSPILGLGIGSFQNAVQSVQSFHYETRYAHNHYIQTLAETGIIGLILFISLLVTCAIAILRARRRDNMHPLVPALGATLIFMAGHAAVEVVFSYYAYLPIAFGVFALINICAATSPSKLTVKAKGGILGGIAIILVVFGILLSCNMTAKKLVTAIPAFETLEQAAKIDKYEWADYMLAYIRSIENAADYPEIQAQAADYAARLEKVDSNALPLFLAQYYFDQGNMEKGFEMIKKYVNYVSSNPSSWESAFSVLQTYEIDSADYRNGVAEVVALLENWNAENIGKIELTSSTLEFLEQLGL